MILIFFIFFSKFELGASKGVASASSHHGKPAPLCPVALTQLGAERQGVFLFCLRQMGPEMAEANSKKGKKRQPIQRGRHST